MKIVVDSAIPFVNGIFEPYADVVYRNGEDIRREDVIDADALLIRTRTRCDRELLHDTAVKMIATATVGKEHIDSEWCDSKGIYIHNSAGSNAGGVADYVFSAIYGIAARKGYKLEGATLGVIGGGATGSRVATFGRLLGFKVLICDPKLAETENPEMYCDLDVLLRSSDIVTLHVPLNEANRDMANARFFSQMKLDAMFINTAHGDLVVDEDLLQARQKLGPVVIDTWRNEPDINMELMEAAAIATPHIAGYSYQSKLLGSEMAVRAIARFFSIKELYEFFPVPDVTGLDAVKLDTRGRTQGQITSDIQYNYPIFTDDFMFRINPTGFVDLRKNYRYRREFFID